VEAGTLRELSAVGGVIRNREVGTGPGVVFVHGILASVSKRYMLEAARSFPRFDRPVLIAWGDRDPFFSPRLGLQHDFPDARLEAVAGSRASVPEDGPEQLAKLVQKFCDERLTSPRSGSPEEVFFGD
jgi:hypothetical protein